MWLNQQVRAKQTHNACNPSNKSNNYHIKELTHFPRGYICKMHTFGFPNVILKLNRVPGAEPVHNVECSGLKNINRKHS